ncbi:MAG: hypothetical protein ACUVRA_01895 [Candidatus Bathyarchaeaceae archaeon]
MKKFVTLAILAVLLLQTVSVGWAWQMERPHRPIAVQDRVESASTNGEASVGLGVAAYNYIEGPDRYGASDFLSMNVSMTANSRVGISYKYDIGSLWWIHEDLLFPRYTLNLGDDDGAWVDMPYGIFRFYGGQYSAEYQKVWICSNGFVAFDEREYARAPTQYTSSTPQDIAYSGAPNAIIAAVWTDLVPDASTKIFAGKYQEPFGDYTYFVIMWKNIKHKLSGERLTFEIILGNAWNYRQLIQSFIYISYMDVKAINTQFA